VRDVRRRTTVLASIHVVLASASLALLAVLAARIELLVTLAQRSNVETLIILFFAAFVAVLLMTTGPATVGALTLFALRLRPHDRRQHWIQAHHVERVRAGRTAAFFNLWVSGPGGAIALPLEDGFGGLGCLRIRGVEMQLENGPAAIAGPLFELTEAVLAPLVRRAPFDSPLRVVLWADIDRSESEAYRSQAHAFGRLAEAMGTGPLWPAAEIDAEGVARLRAALEEAAPHLREAALLRDVAYSAEFSIPLVPEPLAFVQIRRQESRADPVASMGCATVMVLATLAAVLWVVLSPPWVPGK